MNDIHNDNDILAELLICNTVHNNNDNITHNNSNDIIQQQQYADNPNTNTML